MQSADIFGRENLFEESFQLSVLPRPGERLTGYNRLHIRKSIESVEKTELLLYELLASQTE